MAREWGGVEELGRGCWWLAGFGVGLVDSGVSEVGWAGDR